MEFDNTYPPFYNDISFTQTYLGNNLVLEDGTDSVSDGYHTGVIRIGSESPKTIYGYLEYTLEDDGSFIINMIRVYDQYRRKGYATEMLRYAKRKYSPTKELEWGAMFEPGRLLKESRKYEEYRKKKLLKLKLKKKVIKPKRKICSCKRK